MITITISNSETDTHTIFNFTEEGLLKANPEEIAYILMLKLTQVREALILMGNNESNFKFDSKDKSIDEWRMDK
jgi:hypothetical protein